MTPPARRDHSDHVVWCQPTDGGAPFPVYVFGGDTDMATDGWVALTSMDRPEIVRTTLTDEEYRAYDSGGDACARRINTLLDREDLYYAEFLRYERGAAPGGDHAVYRRPGDPDTEGAATRRVTVRDSVREGGTVLDLPGP